MIYAVLLQLTMFCLALVKCIVNSFAFSMLNLGTVGTKDAYDILVLVSITAIYNLKLLDCHVFVLNVDKDLAKNNIKSDVKPFFNFSVEPSVCSVIYFMYR